MNGDLTVGRLVAFQSLMSSFMGPIQGLVGLSGQAAGDQGRPDAPRRRAALPERPAVRHERRERDSRPPRSCAPSSRAPSSCRTSPSATAGSAPPLIEDFSLYGPAGRARRARRRVGQRQVHRRAARHRALQPLVRRDPVRRPALRDDRRATCSTTRVASVDQDIFLFEGTVRDNLTLWDDTVPEEQLTQAAKDACIHRRHRRPRRRLRQSRGRGRRQLQRRPAPAPRDRAGARARPEPPRPRRGHGALDTITEKEIDDNLRRRGCTCLIVAHRLSTIRDADEIIVLDHGKVVQRGTHEQLMAQPDGQYAQLIATE